MSSEYSLAENLLQINAVILNPQQPFTWASGWKSPIYCDNRKTLSHPSLRNAIKMEMSNLILRHFPEVQVIAGVATAGIPIGVLVADHLNLPFIYVRSAAKEHGLQNNIEGNLLPNQNVIVIEDLISTGKSSMHAIQSIQNVLGNVIGLCSIFTYQFPQAAQLFEKAAIPVHSLSNYNALIEIAEQKNYITKNELKALKEWRENPSNWQKV